MNHAHDVFISYAYQDKDAANAICAALEKDGLRCWIAPRDVNVTQDYTTSVAAGLTASRLVLLVVSATSDRLPQVRKEIERADELRRPVLSVRIDAAVTSSEIATHVSGRPILDAPAAQLTTHLGRITTEARALLHLPVRPVALAPPIPDAAAFPETMPPTPIPLAPRPPVPALVPAPAPVPAPADVHRPASAPARMLRMYVVAGALVTVALVVALVMFLLRTVERPAERVAAPPPAVSSPPAEPSPLPTTAAIPTATGTPKPSSTPPVTAGRSSTPRPSPTSAPRGSRPPECDRLLERFSNGATLTEKEKEFLKNRCGG